MGSDLRLFIRHDNGVTITCDDANVGDTGIVDGVIYTKRAKTDITADNAATTCTSGITDMSNLFNPGGAFNANPGGTFNEDIGHWDTSSATRMDSMFHGAGSFNRDIGAWDTGNAVTMNRMFRNARAFNQDIGGWNTGKVENMFAMFNNANAFNQDIGGWNTENVTAMDSMFNRASVFNPRSVGMVPAVYSTAAECQLCSPIRA